jgi:hypothetical protein
MKLYNFVIIFGLLTFPFISGRGKHIQTDGDVKEEVVIQQQTTNEVEEAQTIITNGTTDAECQYLYCPKHGRLLSWMKSEEAWRDAE